MKFVAAILSLATALSVAHTLNADLIIIDELNDVATNVGQFNQVFGSDPNSSPGQVTEILNMGNQQQPDTQTGTIAAGSIWTVFNDGGISSLDRLILSMGINETGPVGSNSVDVESLRLRVEDPNNLGTFLLDVNIDTPSDNTVRVFNYAQGTNTAEALFAVNLPFDFMQTFSSASTSDVILDVTVTNRSNGFEIFFFDSAVNIPEPGAFALLFTMAGVLTLRRRR